MANNFLSFKDDDKSLVSNCPVCGNAYKEIKLAQFKEKGRNQIVKLTCPNCGTQGLALIFSKRDDIFGFGLVTQFSPKKTNNIKNKLDSKLLDGEIAEIKGNLPEGQA